VRGTRIKNIVDELNGEKIDIIRWDEEQEVFIPNTLKPAEVTGILLSPENQVATVVVPNDQLSLAIGKRGQNVRLASKLAGWDIDIITEVELEREREREESGGTVEEDVDGTVSSEDGAGSEVEEPSLAEDAGSEEVEK